MCISTFSPFFATYHYMVVLFSVVFGKELEFQQEPIGVLLKYRHYCGKSHSVGKPAPPAVLLLLLKFVEPDLNVSRTPHPRIASPD
jgi:hypothetical protein